MTTTITEYYASGTGWKRYGRNTGSDPLGPVPSTDLPDWTMVQHEDFSRDAALGSFDAVYGGSGSNGWNGYDQSLDTSKNGLYYPDKVLSVSGKILDVYLHYDGTVTHNDKNGTSQTGWPLVAAPLPNGKGAGSGQLYGRYWVRYKSPVITGYKIAFLLWPDSDDWNDGEIDLPEANLFGSDKISGFVHQPGNPSQNALSAFSTQIAADSTNHISEIEWTPDGVTFFVDGVQIGTTNISPTVPMHLVLQVETQLSGGAPSSAVSGHLQISGVAIWSYNPTPDWVLGQTKPSAANTGLNVLGLTTADLTTVINGDLLINDAYITAHGTTFDRYWVKGFVVMTAATSCKFTNSQLEGRGGFTASTRTTNGVPAHQTAGIQPTAVIHARNQTGGKISAENCKIFPIQPDLNLTTCAGEAIGHFYRCDLSLGSDGLDYWANGHVGFEPVIDVQGCYFHDYTVWVNDNKHPTDGRYPYRSHNDYIQTSGCKQANVVGNFFEIHFTDAYGDAATVKTQNFPLKNWGCGFIITLSGNHGTKIKIYNNWFKGGEQHAFFPFQGGASYTQYQTGNDWECYGNRHAYDIHGWGPYSPGYSKQWYEVGDGEVNAYYGGNVGLSCHDNIFDPNDPSCIAAGVAGQAIPAMSLKNGNQWLSSSDTVAQT